MVECAWSDTDFTKRLARIFHNALLHQFQGIELGRQSRLHLGSLELAHLRVLLLLPA